MSPSGQSLAKGLYEGRVKADDLVNVSLNFALDSFWRVFVTRCDEDFV
jgi:hypothetical protein